MRCQIADCSPEADGPSLSEIWYAWAGNSTTPYHIKDDAYPEILIDGSPGFPTWLIIVHRDSINAENFIEQQAELLLNEYGNKILQERLQKLLYVRNIISELPELFHDRCEKALKDIESTLVAQRLAFSRAMEGSIDLNKLRCILQDLVLLDSRIEELVVFSAKQAISADAQESLYEETCRYAVNLGGEQLVYLLSTAPRPSTTLTPFAMVQSRRQAIDQLQATVRTMVEIETAKLTKSLNTLVLWGALVTAASLSLTLASQKISFKNIAWTWWVEAPSRWFGLGFFIVSAAFLLFMGRRIGLHIRNVTSEEADSLSPLNHTKYLDTSDQHTNSFEDLESASVSQSGESADKELRH